MGQRLNSEREILTRSGDSSGEDTVSVHTNKEKGQKSKKNVGGGKGADNTKKKKKTSRMGSGQGSTNVISKGLAAKAEHTVR